MTDVLAFAGAGSGSRTYIADVRVDADLRWVTNIAAGSARKSAAVLELRQAYDDAIGPVRTQLDALVAAGIVSTYREYPLGGKIAFDVPDDHAARAWVELRSVGVFDRIIRDRTIAMKLPTPDVASTHSTAARPWNVDVVGAPAAWNRGYTGSDVVIGILDTGALVEHPALAPTYRGTQPDGSRSDDYSFFDAFGETTEPVDVHGHGTHVTGIAAGAAEEIGIAPGARWIAARMMGKDAPNIRGEVTTTTENIAKALEWMLAPTDSSGAAADPSMAPDIVSNSWSIGPASRADYQRYWDAFDAAGIIVVAAAGNDGPDPGSVTSPGSYPNGITIASTDRSDKVARSSGRGPAAYPRGSETAKPDIAAPGVSIRSSVRTGGYGMMSGTSMATPSLAGALALMKCANPDLTRVDALDVLQRTAVDVSTPGFDYDSGAGRYDVAAAITELVTVGRR